MNFAINLKKYVAWQVVVTKRNYKIFNNFRNKQIVRQNKCVLIDYAI